MIRIGFYTRRDGLAGIDKVPAEQADYTLDWSDELREGESVAACTWATDGLTEMSSGRTASTTTVRLSGGVAGAEHRVVATMTKDNGEIVPRTFVVAIVANLS